VLPSELGAQDRPATSGRVADGEVVAYTPFPRCQDGGDLSRFLGLVDRKVLGIGKPDGANTGLGLLIYIRHTPRV
jgi:hypothetical protein